MENAPEITPAFIAWLEQVFPDKAPTLDMSDRQVWHAVGQVSVVSHLRGLMIAQQEEAKETQRDVPTPPA